VKNISIQVKPHAYDVLIEHGILKRCGRELARVLPERSRFYIVTTSTVRKHWGGVVAASLAQQKLTHHFFEMPEGERHKTMSTVEELAGKLIKSGADRESVVVALGGGVVGDVAGLLASLYMRGIDLVQAPTTFLAQVDAAIGGKTGVNLRQGKNLLGTFHQPRCVLVDPGALATLPEREYRSGLYEALKCGIIDNGEIFERMEQERHRILARDPELLEWLIAECVKVKAAVVAADEKESDQRRVLNFGHTIGHALEAETKYRHFLHGEAVGWGMVAAAMIAAATQKTDLNTARRIISAVLAYAALPKVESRGKKVVKRIRADKKTVHGATHFVLPREIGRVEIVRDVPERTILEAVEELRYLSQS